MPAKTNPPAFESWGRYPKHRADVVPLYWTSDFPLPVPPEAPMLPVGMGRSYGDSCLLDGGTLLAARGLDRFISFDPAIGLLRCEAGVTLAEILDFAVPRGWFLPVTPGTKYVTVGGAIANDIHGKNHHVAGTFGRHVQRFELVRSDGTRFVCSPIENPEWFAATIGGMGLSGLITWVELPLRPIVSRQSQYQGGKSRGVFMQGDHAETPGPLTKSKAPKLPFPFNLPEFALNRLSMAAFNSLYFHKQLAKQKVGPVDY